MITKAYVISALRAVSMEYDVPFDILKAVATVESSLRATAFNPNDAGPGKHSYGLFQLNSVLIRHKRGELGEGCARELPKKERVYKNCKWFGPKTNARFAARHLAHLINKHDGDMVRALCAYNRGSLKYDESGFCVNMNYVLKVFKEIK